jgi:uncharacterized damage-inducible protein DinB
VSEYHKKGEGMINSEYCRMLAGYNRWMNNKLYTLCENLPDKERKRDRQLFFRSIHGTLNHILFADMPWLSRFKQEPVDLPPMGTDLYADFGELRRAREVRDADIADWADSLTDDWLRADFTYTSRLDNVARTQPNWMLAAHLFNHGTHHRGQVTAALSALGVDYGSTDIPFMPGD